MKFVPLHVITGYSLLQSGLTIERIIRALKKNDYFGMGISDNEVLYGAAPFVKAMEKADKPFVIGESFNIGGDTLCLYVISEEGYLNLIKLDIINQQSELTLEILKEHSSGLVAILETVRGTFKEKFVENYDSSFNRYLLNLSSPFKDNFYLGIEVTSREEFKYANRVRAFANEFTYQCIAFPRIRYEKKDGAIIYEMVTAIANDEKLEIKEKQGEEYFYTEENYAKIYTKSEMENTIKLVESSTFKFEIKRAELLHYPVNDPKEELQRLCEEKLNQLGLHGDKYNKRLEYELSVINKMGYADYFLIVQDYVNYAKNNGILVGPGRGSAAGSLVAYLLNITEINPLDYDLQFERFLNPYRQTMPDIDVDFMDSKRDAMIQYMREKYGDDRVAIIATFQTIGAKQALRDVGRLYDYNPKHIDLLSKKIVKDYSLADAYRKVPEFRDLVDSDKYFLEIVNLASKIEGLPRQSGLHPAGVILNDRPLEDSIPVSVLADDKYVSQYEAEYLEEQGLLKMDFLSLSNLTIINNCVELINLRHSLNLKANEIPYKGKEIYDLIASNRVLGLFQIETQLMRRSISMLKPSTFDDVVALLALGRPGPMEFIPTYAKRKEGKQRINYISEDLKEILAPTYGIIVYQEQINSIATKMAGFSLGEADMFRRAVSKKDKEKMMGLEKSFIMGAKKKGYEEKTSKAVFNDILKFADYGFNKSHSVVYAIIACREAWLKAHYPLEFYTALLGGGATIKDMKFFEYVSEMKSLGINMLPPSINYSTNDFVIKDNNLLFPLNGINGINITVMNKIKAEREENGLFTDFFNFALRMFKYHISEDNIINLIDAGAFDEFYPSRASMRLSVKSALQYAELNYNEDGQMNLGIDVFGAPIMRKAEDNPMDNLEKEQEVLGIMLSNNPLAFKREQIEAKNAISISDAKEQEENRATIAGILRVKKTINTKKGQKMAYVKFFDQSGDMEVIFFPKLFEEASSLLEKNHIYIIDITRSINRGEEQFIADKIERLED